MDREILFRGKDRFSGAWRFGDFMHGNERKTLRDSIWVYQPDTQNYLDYQVDPSTVGQYTGLTDKNGVKIFEGDIIKTKKYGKIVGHTNVNDFDIFEVVYIPCRFRLIKKNRGFDLVDDGYSKLEVIGNIHDNPEMLEGNENVF